MPFAEVVLVAVEQFDAGRVFLAFVRGFFVRTFVLDCVLGFELE